jgi:hypothetical protein
VRFADEKLERAGFEAQVLPFAEAEFEVERKVSPLPRTPEPRDFAQEPPVVDDLHRREARTLDKGFDVLMKQFVGSSRLRAVQRVFGPFAGFFENPVHFRAQLHRFEQTFHFVSPLSLTTSFSGRA